MYLPRTYTIVFSICASVSLALVLGACGRRDHTATTSRPRKHHTRPADEQVLALLKQMLKDSANDLKRNNYLTNHLLQFAGAKHWYKVYPTQYAEEKLLSQGKAIVEPLLRIVFDPQHAELRWAAWSVLERFEDPRILKAIFDAASKKQITAGQLTGLLRGHLPVHVSSAHLHEDSVIQWLGKQLAAKGYDQIRLDLLDEFMKAKPADGGIWPGVSDIRAERWLNRFYDIDLDAWLAQKAPKALEFRRKQLTKGYDPVVTFSSLRGNIAAGLLEEALVSIFPDPEDRKACSQLLEAAYDESSPLHPKETPGWEQRLRDWYWSQRESLRYDFSLLRFRPAKNTVSGQSESAPQGIKGQVKPGPSSKPSTGGD